MKHIISTLVLASVAIALPQAPPQNTQPTATITIASSPRPVGQLPSEGLRNVPFPGSGGFASYLGFDEAKATPDPSGAKCQTVQNGKFCFTAFGGTFTLGHPGGAFDGSTWNPFQGAAGSGIAGGLLAGGVGSPDDIAPADYYRYKDSEESRTSIGNMKAPAAELESSNRPMEKEVSRLMLT